MANAQSNIKAVITAEDRSKSVLAGFSNNVRSLGNHFVNVAKKASIALGTASVAAAGFAVKSATDFEQTRIGLENMLGSADKARALLGDISKFAADTPFEFPELAQATRQLVAFGFSAEDAFSTMKQLGDVSAAVGAPINDLAYLMGTLRAQGRAFTIDIRQFAMRGIPIYEYLGKVLGKNTQQITEMIEAGKIGFPEVQKAFQAMTAEGGAFHGTMAKQSKSLSGLFSTLKDVIGQTARELVGITSKGDVKEGSLFDNLRKATAWLILNLPNAIQTVKDAFNNALPTLQQWATNIANVATQIGDYLWPKLQSLWTTISTQVIPILTRLWQEVLQPLVPVIGTILVIAIGLLIDAFNLFFSVIVPIFTWMLDNKPIVIGLAVAFGTLALAMNFTKIVASFQVSMMAAAATMNTIKTVTLPGLYTALATFGGFAVLAGLAAGAAVAIIKSANDARKAWDDAHKSIDQGSRTQEASIKRLQELIKTGTPEQKSRAMQSLKAIANNASGTSFFPGGLSVVGERGPELVTLPRGSGVIPNDRTERIMGNNQPTINITIQAGAFMGSQQEARKYAQMIMSAYSDALQAKGMA